MIVDDEKNIRVGLKAMITREFGSAYTLYFAADGEEALEILDGTELDVIITDIRMPVMDGISFINQLQERETKPEVIILSGHDDFQYAKAAIRFNVKEYLLKPIVRDELFRTLRRLEIERQRKGELAKQLRATLRLKEEYAASQLNYVFLHEQLQPEEVSELVQKTELDWLDEGYYAALVKVPDNYKGSGRSEFISRMDEIIGWTSEEHFIRFYDKDAKLVLLSSSEEPFERLSGHMIQQPSVSFRAGMSDKNQGMEKVKVAYVQAGSALKYSLFQTFPHVIRPEELSSKDMGYKLPLEDVQKIANMLGLDREGEMNRLLHHVFDIRVIMRNDIGYLEGISRAFNEGVFDKVFQIYGEESVEILKLHRMVGNIYNFNHFHDYFHSLESLLFLLNDYVKRMRSVHNDRNEMQRAISYIHEHYQENLNMAMVSNYVSLNYSYFSQTFKEFTGEAFVGYLRKLRIHKAKELLESTDMKVYEISAKAGFENVKHFTRVFREMEGIAPLEYRSRSEMLSEQ